MEIIIGLAAGLVLFLALTAAWYFLIIPSKRAALTREAKEAAEKEAEVIKQKKLLEVKDKFLSKKAELEKEVRQRNQQIQQAENRAKQRELSLNQKQDELTRRKQETESLRQRVETQQALLQKREEELDERKNNLLEQERTKLEEISGISAEEAKERLVEALKDEAKTNAQAYINEIMDDAKMTANKEAKRIIIQTIQRVATETAVENSVTVFHIDNDEVKGRIIGREGRNIRALEAATGVEIVVDDTPEAIVISAFDPVRREICRLAMHQLVADGRIHPARIEEVVAKVKKQVEEEIIETGKRTTIDLGVHGLHPELIRIIGKMKYRSSYGQNLLQHARETANLCAVMASELGLNPKKAKRAGLLHDIGKVPDEEPELPHALYGAKLAEKYKEKADICNASPRRDGDDHTAGSYRASVRCHQWSTSRSAPRNRGSLHQASQGLGEHCHELPWRGEDLCHPGRSRAACDSGCRQDRRQADRGTEQRDSHQDPERDDLSRTGQDYGYPRDTFCVLRQMTLPRHLRSIGKLKAGGKTSRGSCLPLVLNLCPPPILLHRAFARIAA